MSAAHSKIPILLFFAPAAIPELRFRQPLT
jgi:hypothetical protein